MALALGRLEIVVDVLEVDADVAAPAGHGLGLEDLQTLQAEVAHPAGSRFISEISATISAQSLAALNTYCSSLRKSYLLISPIGSA